MIDQVLVAERQGEHPLPDQRAYLMLGQLRAARVGKAWRQPIDQADGAVCRSQQQPAGDQCFKRLSDGSS